MKHIIRTLLLSMILIATNHFILFGQNTEQKSIEVGDQTPDIKIGPLINSQIKEIQLSELKGKLVILDFWATWCGPCLTNIPKTDRLQKQFANKVKVILVNTESRATVEDFFKNTRLAKGLVIDLPSVYSDIDLNKLFPHFTIPHTVIINPNGKVIAITSAENVTSENISKALLGDVSGFPLKTDRKRGDENEPFFNSKMKKTLYKNDGEYGINKLRFKSVITGHLENYGSGAGHYMGRIISENEAISSLFLTAYSYSLSNKLEPFYFNRLILDVKHPEKYVYPKDTKERTDWAKENTYSYDLVFPDSYRGLEVSDGPDSIRKFACEVMKKDIEAFTGLKSALEKRLVDCLVIKCLDSTKINSKENFGPSKSGAGRIGAVINFKNFSSFVRIFKQTLQKKEPLIDDTGYTGRVNIEIKNVSLTDVDRVNLQLKNFGLAIVKEPRMIDMLIVTDKK